MLFCQVGRAHSLREICGGLASVEGNLNHLGSARMLPLRAETSASTLKANRSGSP